ncbi:MAG TPA: pantoate--beta-alanine ligase [Candidatus Tumulicola sp.]|jgi:pantoate--beta-alanine ligase
MQFADTIEAARAMFAALPRPFGFIPTMGALHEGHLQLVRAARERCASAGVSIFVNPMQFGPQEDFAAYPRDLERDRAALSSAGANALFAPDGPSMYPQGFSTTVDPGPIGTTFEGAVRPGHFRGVATVVTKLLQITAPDVLFLGQKDAQQAVVLQRTIVDLAIPVRVVVVPTVREADGLAMSSRNAYLDPAQRAAAPSLHRALEAMRDELLDGASKAYARVAAESALSPSGTPEYFDAVDASTFEPIERLDRDALIVGAARFGSTRLIDNVPVPIGGAR